MLDLGLSFLASVARDPTAIAIVDGELRLSYAQWYRRISALVAGFDAIGLRPGDHLVTALQNRWEAASLHWACQFAGIIITPVNWRSTTSEIDFFLADAEAKAIAYEDVSAAAVAGSALAQKLPRIALDAATPSDLSFAALASQPAPDATARTDAEAWSVMLYTSGTTARPKGVPRRQRAERAAAIAHVAQNLYANGERTLGVMPLYHTMGVRSLLAMSLIGGAFVCLRRFDVDRALELIAAERVTNLYLVPTLYHDLVHHPRFATSNVEFGQETRLCRRADDRRPAENAAGGIPARSVRQSLRLVGNLHLHHRSERAEKARLGRPRRHQPNGARGEAWRQVGR